MPGEEHMQNIITRLYEEVVEAWNAQSDYANNWDNLGEDEKIAFAMELEREACAKVCEDVMLQVVLGSNDDYNEGRQMGATVCANKIRARFNAPKLTGRGTGPND